MYPITHIWFAEKVLQRKSSSLVLGAVFPDIAVTRSLNYLETHYCGWKLFHHLKKYSLDFAQAMITHTVSPMGLDYYGDERYQTGYKGYCFQKGQQIVEQVIEACNIPESFGLWKAHNFVEMGIELNVAENHPILVQELHDAFRDNAAISNVGEALEEYFSLDRGEIAESFGRFSGFIELEQPNCHTLAVKYNMQMQSKHNISIQIDRSAEIIERCRDIVQEDFNAFMKYCTINIKALLEGGVNHQ